MKTGDVVRTLREGGDDGFVARAGGRRVVVWPVVDGRRRRYWLDGPDSAGELLTASQVAHQVDELDGQRTTAGAEAKRAAAGLARANRGDGRRPPTVRHREVLGRVGEQFSLTDLKESACHRSEGYTRRMVTEMQARGAVEALPGGDFRKTQLALPVCLRADAPPPPKPKRSRKGKGRKASESKPSEAPEAEGEVQALPAISGRARRSKAAAQARAVKLAKNRVLNAVWHGEGRAVATDGTRMIEVPTNYSGPPVLVDPKGTEGPTWSAGMQASVATLMQMVDVGPAVDVSVDGQTLRRALPPMLPTAMESRRSHGTTLFRVRGGRLYVESVRDDGDRRVAAEADHQIDVGPASGPDALALVNTAFLKYALVSVKGAVRLRWPRLKSRTVDGRTFALLRDMPLFIDREDGERHIIMPLDPNRSDGFTDPEFLRLAMRPVPGGAPVRPLQPGDVSTEPDLVAEPPARELAPVSMVADRIDNTRDGVYGLLANGGVLPLHHGSYHWNDARRLLKPLDLRGAWTVVLVRPGRGRPNLNDRKTAANLMAEAKRSPPTVGRVVLYTSRVYPLEGPAEGPADAPVDPPPAGPAFRDFRVIQQDTGDPKTYVSPDGTLVMLKAGRAWWILRRGERDRLWRMMAGPLKYADARAAVPEVFAAELPPAPSLAGPPTVAQSMNDHGKLMQARAHKLMKQAITGIAHGDRIDLSPLAGAPVVAELVEGEPTGRGGKWRVNGAEVQPTRDAARVVGWHAHGTFVVPAERTDVFDLHWLKYALRDYGCLDFGALTSRFWFVHCGPNEAQAVQVIVEQEGAGWYWRRSGHGHTQHGPFHRASALLDDMVAGLGLDVSPTPAAPRSAEHMPAKPAEQSPPAKPAEKPPAKPAEKPPAKPAERAAEQSPPAKSAERPPAKPAAQRPSAEPTFVLVGCVKRKVAQGPVPARDLYRGDLWARRRAYAEARGLPWGIVSAELGVVAPETPATRYERRIEDLDAAQLARWQKDAQKALGELVGRGAVVEVIASRAYVDALRPPAAALGITLVAPLEGKGIGARKKWLAERTAELTPTPPSRGRREASPSGAVHVGAPPADVPSDRRLAWMIRRAAEALSRPTRGLWVVCGEHVHPIGLLPAGLDVELPAVFVDVNAGGGVEAVEADPGFVLAVEPVDQALRRYRLRLTEAQRERMLDALRVARGDQERLARLLRDPSGIGSRLSRKEGGFRRERVDGQHEVWTDKHRTMSWVTPAGATDKQVVEGFFVEMARRLTEALPDDVRTRAEAVLRRAFRMALRHGNLKPPMARPKSRAKPSPAPPAKPSPAPLAKPSPAPPAKPPAKPSPAPLAKPSPAPPAKPSPKPPAKPSPKPPAKPSPDSSPPEAIQGLNDFLALPKSKRPKWLVAVQDSAGLVFHFFLRNQTRKKAYHVAQQMLAWSTGMRLAVVNLRAGDAVEHLSRVMRHWGASAARVDMSERLAEGVPEVGAQRTPEGVRPGEPALPAIGDRPRRAKGEAHNRAVLFLPEDPARQHVWHIQGRAIASDNKRLVEIPTDYTGPAQWLDFHQRAVSSPWAAHSDVFAKILRAMDGDAIVDGRFDAGALMAAFTHPDFSDDLSSWPFLRQHDGQLYLDWMDADDQHRQIHLGPAAGTNCLFLALSWQVASALVGATGEVRLRLRGWQKAVAARSLILDRLDGERHLINSGLLTDDVVLAAAARPIIAGPANRDGGATTPRASGPASRDGGATTPRASGPANRDGGATTPRASGPASPANRDGDATTPPPPVAVDRVDAGRRLAEEHPGDWPEVPDKPGPRTIANLRAVQIAHEAARSGQWPTAEQQRQMLLYSGWGGLSIDKVRGDWPEGVPLPQREALIHEYYTPWAVCADITAVVRRLLDAEPGRRERVRVLEPSAGVGRFVHAGDFEGWHWTAVELSPLSRLILAQTARLAEVHGGSFEAWVQANPGEQFDAVIANPPYGPRGEHKVEDKDRTYRVNAAYQYFVLRGLSLLAPNGVAAFLIPGGFLTGSSTRKLRQRVDGLADLAGAFRLPSGLFPGARLSLDVVFFRARRPGRRVVDAVFVDGHYFDEHPAHVLGEIKPSGRWGDPEVIGEYTGLPAFVERRPEGAAPAEGARRVFTTAESDYDYPATREVEVFDHQGRTWRAVDLTDPRVANHQLRRYESGNHAVQDVDPRLAGRLAPAFTAVEADVGDGPDAPSSGRLAPGFTGLEMDDPAPPARTASARTKPSGGGKASSGRKSAGGEAGEDPPPKKPKPRAGGKSTRKPAKPGKKGLPAGLRDIEMERRTRPLDEALELAGFFVDPRDPVLRGIRVADGLVIASDGTGLVEIAVDDAGPARVLDVDGQVLDVDYPAIDALFPPADPLATVDPAPLDVLDGRSRRLADGTPVEIAIDGRQLRYAGEEVKTAVVARGSACCTWHFDVHRLRPMLLGGASGRILLGTSTAPMIIERDDGLRFMLLPSADPTCATCPPRRPAPAPAAESDDGPPPAAPQGPSEAELAALLAARVAGFEAAGEADRVLLYAELAAALDAFHAVFGRRLATLDRPVDRVAPVAGDAAARRLLATFPAGVPLTQLRDPAALLGRGWRVDGDRLLPKDDYLSGDLWTRIARLESVPPELRHRVPEQRAELEAAIGEVVYAQIEDRVSLRDGWIPLDVIAAFAGQKARRSVALVRQNGLVQPANIAYQRIVDQYGTGNPLRLLIGYLNHDEQLFKPRYNKDAGEKLNEKRRERAEEFEREFRAFLATRADLRERVTDAYRRSNRGFVPRTYPGDPLPLARWGSAVQPHPHQNAGARRAVDQRGMVAAYGVGVGKTYTACATVALARQQLGTRRPVILVPNSLVSKWQRDIHRALPDFAVVTIGEQATRGRDGKLRFGPDEKADRELKWRRFAAGLYDLALVTPSAFVRTRFEADEYERFVANATEVQRTVRLAQRNVQRATNPTERQQAVLEQGVRGFLAEKMELPETWERDDVRWAQLGVDLLIVDEAQNYKGLHSPESREGSVPRFMGQSAASKRAWNLDARAREVRARDGFVVLLSATPAKNSPLELYNLWSYVSDRLWRDHGIHDPEAFISRFLTIEPRLVIDAMMEATERPAVTSFKRLDELKSILLRWGEFIQPADIGLVVPEPSTELVEVDMDERQESKYSRYVRQIEDALDAMRARQGSGNRVLGLLARMSLVAIHADMDRGLSYRTAGGRDPSAPKFEAIADYVLAHRECGHIVFLQAIAGHRWLKETLARRGIPERRIGVLNGELAKSSDARQRIADRFNAGELDVVIANSIAYEGLDLQVRTCAIHHADLPWEPATLNQRNGRAVRQGNTLDTVAIRYYFSRRSMDGLRFNLIQGKQGWMGALLEGSDAIANPGADLELGPEEILLLISRTPEQTRMRLDALKAKMEAKRRWDELERAHRLLATGAGQLLEARDAVDPERAERLRAGAVEALDALERTIDPSIWPWHRILRAARRAGVDEILAREGSPPLFPGAWLRVGDNWFEVGRFNYLGINRTVALRRAGAPVWTTHHQVAEVATERAIDDVSPRRPDDVADDWQAALPAIIPSTLTDRNRGWQTMGWHLASPAWLEAAWAITGEEIARSLREMPSWQLPARARLPYALDGAAVVRSSGEAAPAGAELLPPTAEGWDRWLRLTTDGVPLELRTEASNWWWGRPLRRGMQRARANPSTPTRRRGPMPIDAIDLPRQTPIDSHLVIGLDVEGRVAELRAAKGARDAQRVQKTVRADIPVVLIARVDNNSTAKGGRRGACREGGAVFTQRDIKTGAGVVLVGDDDGHLCQLIAERDLAGAYRAQELVPGRYPRAVIAEVRYRYAEKPT